MIKQLDKSLKKEHNYLKFAMVNMNYWQKGKQKTTTITTKVSKLSSVLLTSSLLVLSSITAAQLLVSDNTNAAFAALNCDTVTTEGTFEYTCTGGGGGDAGFQDGGGGGQTTCTTDTGEDFDCTTLGGGSGSKPDSGEGG